jgi:hypothetical protein
MESSDVLAYVKAAALLQGLSLDEAAAARVAEHLGRTASMARLLDEVELGPEVELAEIFRPAAFPDARDPDFLA